MRPPFSFDPTALLSPVGRVPCRDSQEAGRKAAPAARDTSGFDDDEAQRGSGSVNRGQGADVRPRGRLHAGCAPSWRSANAV